MVLIGKVNKMKYFLTLIIATVLWHNGELVKKVDASNNSVVSRGTLEGQHLKIVCTHYPPPIVVLRNETGHVIGYSGLLYEMVVWLSSRLHFTYDIVPYRDNSNGVRRNGSWTGVIGADVRKEADLAVSPVSISHERYGSIDFAALVLGDGFSILIKYPTSTLSPSATFDVFSLTVWLGIVASAIAVFLFSLTSIAIIKPLIRQQANNDVKGNRYITPKAREVAQYLLSVLTSQGGYVRWSSKPLRLLSAIWCLSATILVYSYSSTLTTYLSLSYQKPPINSFEELANSSSYRFAILDGTVIREQYLTAESGLSKMLGDKLRKCPECTQQFVASVANYARKDNWAAIIPTSGCRSQIQADFVKRKRCGLTMAKEETSFSHMAFPITKSNPYLEVINRGSMWWFSFGMRDYWRNKMERFPKQRLLNYNGQGVSIKRANSHALKLQQFAAAFYLLLAGYVAAFLAFVVEKCRERMRRTIVAI